jgi:Tol biopolymer transport system component
MHAYAIRSAVLSFAAHYQRLMPLPRRTRRAIVRRIAIFFLGVAIPCLSHAAPGDTFVASFNSSGQRVGVFDYDVSADGQYTVFATNEQVTDTVPPDGSSQVYLYDRVSGQHELVSLDARGEPSNAWCEHAHVSADGRFVLMSWYLVGQPGLIALVLRDRLAKTTQRVSQHASWSALSGDGRYVAFTTVEALVPGDTNDRVDVYLWNRETLVTERVSVGYGAGQPNNDSVHVDVSDDGRFVVFTSSATNLVPGDTNGEVDVFVRDRLTKQTRRVSVNSQGAQSNGTSGCRSLAGMDRWWPSVPMRAT